VEARASRDGVDGEAAAAHEAVGLALLTNNQSFAVGTGGEFQVPPLVNLAYRAPYMHNGCAPTLMARFTDASCGGGDTHGRTAQLSTDQLADLIAYLETR
jgi:hypothetical protein